MLDFLSDNRLPLEHTPREAVQIYAKRLAFYIFVFCAALFPLLIIFDP